MFFSGKRKRARSKESNSGASGERPQDAAARIERDLQAKVPRKRAMVFPSGDVCTTGEIYKLMPMPFNRAVEEMRAVVGWARISRVTEGQFESMLKGEAYASGSAESSFLVEGAKRDVSLSRLARDILNQAKILEASDIYIDIVGENTYTSYRTYGLKTPAPGVLSKDQGLEIARSIWSSCNSSFEETHPCDASMIYAERMFRCSSLPTINGGNALVIRMRDPEFYLPLDKAGYSEHQVAAIEEICSSPGGLILVTGETNSGKSTTLATLMADLPSTQKIIEISDPVEVVFPHVSQVAIDRYSEDAEKKFAKVQSSLVRQNPDTLILGEIRDAETVDAAASMALQGKRVMSTLHTQSCILAFSRLADLGMDKNLLYQPGFIAGVINQNLVPLLCSACSRKEPVRQADRERYGERHRALFGGKARYTSGIENCEARCRLGTKGQTLVGEVYPMVRDVDGEILVKLQDPKAVSEVKKRIRDWGMKPKMDHAYRKVSDGQVDPIHAERILGRFRSEDFTSEAAE